MQNLYKVKNVLNFNNLEHSYSNNISNKNIFIIGLYPPPLGGVPIHIERVVRKLELQNNKVTIFDVIKEYKNRSKLSYLRFFLNKIFLYKPNIIHYHTLSLRKYPFELIALIFSKIFLKYELVIINHTPRFFDQKSFIYIKILNFLICFVDKQVLIGSSTYQSYCKNGISLKKISVESPFLPPDITKEASIVSNYSKKLNEFLQTYPKFMLINGSQIKLWNGIDLYGFDMAIELLANLNKDFPDLGLIIAVSSIGDEQYFKEINTLIENKKNIYLLVESSCELWPLIKKATFLIRPTISDSYAISVAEAICFGVPVIASDVCVRPKGSIIFASRNKAELLYKSKVILQGIKNGKNLKQCSDTYSQPTP